MSKLKLPKGKTVVRPVRPSDHISKRGVPYWWAPEWTRCVNGSVGRIKAIKKDDDNVELHMLSKTGNLTYIQGSIQQEFIDWHEDNSIDYLLLGEDADDLIITDWEYE